MYLRSIKLAGFKSFADRARLEFEPGVSVVVGPNGSGKSNLVDAVAWVLGTQAPSSLRSESMDDVIFAGTATRSASGRAEVTLVLDNADRTVPLDLDEVSITRRLYRDGTSDYLIGGVECRLLDVQELMADSGIGRRQHTIVSQGQVDDILSASPADHRSVVEEAAGVLKHRIRKDRAIRRLERTDADLIRLKDVERELQRQIRPLKRQANAAERHEDARADMRALRLYLDGQELARLGDRLGASETERVSVGERIAEAAAERSELEARLEELTAAEVETLRALDRDRAAGGRLHAAVERFQRLAQVARERARVGQASAEASAHRRSTLQSERAGIEETLDRDRATREQLRHEVDQLAAESRELGRAAQSLAEQASLPREGAAAMLRGELASLAEANERDESELAAVERRQAVVEEHLQTHIREQESIESEIRALDEATSKAEAVYGRLRDQREEHQLRWQEADALAWKARIAAAAASAEVTALERSTQQPHSSLEEIVDSPALRKLTDRLDVPDDLAASVRAALGQWADAWAVASRDDVPKVLEALRKSRARGTPIVAAPDHSAFISLPARRVAEQWGAEPLISRLGGSADQVLAGVMLGDVVLVESWSAAWTIVERNPEIRAVTPEGALISARGVILSDPDRTPSVLLGDAQGALEAAKTELARRESLLATSLRALDDLREAERDALEELERVEASLAGATEALDRADREKGALAEELERLEQRSKSLHASLARRGSQMDATRAQLEATDGSGPEARAVRDQLGQRRAEIARQLEAVDSRREDAMSQLAAVRVRLELRSERAEEIRKLLEGDRPSPPIRVARLARMDQMAQRAVEILEQHVRVIDARETDLEALARKTEQSVAAARRRRETLGKETDALKDREAEVAVELTELRLRVESLTEGLRRDIDAPPTEAIDAESPDLDEGVSAHARLEELEAQLRRLGPVNPLASAEFRELSDRHAFLKGQLEDLEGSRRKLREIIRMLDSQIAELFSQAFSQIAAKFERTFGLLFPGGRGRLQLTDPDDLLTTGVEIYAQPLGKKISRLSLLSGGERALAALAFLFSIFGARPSPFYVLDEVEAALDDANLRRFLRLLDDFRVNAQLVVVTHQQQTMEAADVLYGITMDPGGTSVAVSKRMRELASSA